MKILRFSLICLILTDCCFAASYRATEKTKLKYASSFFSAADLMSSRSTSNIKLKNIGTSTKVVYGLYVRQFARVAAGQACSTPTTLYAASQNAAAGAVVMQVSLDANTEAALGANYLYNLIYAANYYVVNLAGPQGCKSPGCTWGSDTTIYHWCIYLGAMSPVSVTAPYTAKVAPHTTNVSGGGFDYNLVSNYETIGPISCDDQALTCSVATAQTQSF